MFYSSEILSIKSNSNLGIVWLAATLGPKSNAKKLARKDLSSISIQSTCSFLMAPPEPLSLRLSANLMVGVSRVYGQQCQFHWNDVQSLCTKINHINKPANPDDIDLPNNEKKGNNITLKKIDCISAVNILPGDPLNFPDFDISSLLSMANVNGGRSSEISSTIGLNPEMGRKSILSSLGTPFSTSSSSNALQGSDFAAAISDSDLGYSMNDHDMMYGSEMSSDIFPLRPRSESNMEFQVPTRIEKRKISRIRRIKNALMDTETMLDKGELFINESEMLQYNLYNLKTEEYFDSIKEALTLLNAPAELFALESFEGIFNLCKFNYSNRNLSGNIDDHIDFNYADDHYDYISGNDNFNDIEEYRNDPNATPSSALYLPWSTNSSSSFSSNKGISSAGINTPIRKGHLNVHSSPSSLSESISGSSPSVKLYNPENNMNLSQESFDFLYYLHDSITSESGIASFGNILKKDTVSRQIAARGFYHLLELKSANLIDVKQRLPFSEIQIIMQ